MIHVIPEDDTREHEETPACWCVPEIRYSGDEAGYIHRAQDGRPDSERRWKAVAT